MIDTIALALGHALLAAALLRLALRVDVDADPLIARLTAQSANERKQRRAAARGPRRGGDDGADRPSTTDDRVDG
jgi:hypothetical protein